MILEISEFQMNEALLSLLITTADVLLALIMCKFKKRYAISHVLDILRFLINFFDL